jgi:hypothetical protein
MPKAMMSYQQRTGTNIPGVNELVLECGKWMKMLKTDYKTARNTLEYHRVHIQQFIPMNSKKSVVATFKKDGLYNHRIARMSEFLMRNVSFASTTKHAETFMSLLTTNNFRSLFLWSKDETGRRQTCLNYDVIESLPKDLKMFIEEERKRHEEEFNKYPRKKSFNPQCEQLERSSAIRSRRHSRRHWRLNVWAETIHGPTKSNVMDYFKIQ